MNDTEYSLSICYKSQNELLKKQNKLLVEKSTVEKITRGTIRIPTILETGHSIKNQFKMIFNGRINVEGKPFSDEEREAARVAFNKELTDYEVVISDVPIVLQFYSQKLFKGWLADLDAAIIKIEAAITAIDQEIAALTNIKA